MAEASLTSSWSCQWFPLALWGPPLFQYRKTTVTCYNNYRPFALTSIIMKCFERLLKAHICSVLTEPAILDPLQFAYQSNRSTDYAIAWTMRTALMHLDKENTSFRMLFIDSNISKLNALDLHTHLCNWILNFLTGRPQEVKIGNSMSSMVTLNNGTPQECMLGPLLYSLFIHNCVSKHSSNPEIC